MNVMRVTLGISTHTPLPKQLRQPLGKVTAAYRPAFEDPITTFQEASSDLAVCTTADACRFGAHLAVAIHDAARRNHSTEQTRYRR
jgi:hypothetical protein